MDQKIIEMLQEMQNDIKSMKSDLSEVKQSVSRIEDKLEGAGSQFEANNRMRIEAVEELDKRVEKVESAIFRLTNN